MTDEALHYFIEKSKLRVILLNGLTSSAIEGLRKLRPTPDAYSIIADTPNMDKLFKRVTFSFFYTHTHTGIKIHFTNTHTQLLDAGLIHLPERWILMFTDNAGTTAKRQEGAGGSNKFKYFDMYPEMSRLLLSDNVCCNPNCICSSPTMVTFELIHFSFFKSCTHTQHERNSFIISTAMLSFVIVCQVYVQAFLF